MGKSLLTGALYLCLLTLPACGRAGSRLELTEEEYRLYRGTGEDLDEQEDLALFGAAVGAGGSAHGQAPLLVTSALIVGRVMVKGSSSPPGGGWALSRSTLQERDALTGRPR
jgi:hypothetical protein